MGLQTQVWARDIAEKLWPSNAFAMKAISDDAWVSNKTVNLPQAGAAPVVERNRSTLPATAVKRTDTNLTYDIDEFTSTPSHIQDIEEIETSYAKRQSVLMNHIEEINLASYQWLAHHWAPSAAAAIIRTTGGDRVANTAGATGNRKKLTIEDLIQAKAKMDDMEVPTTGRHILLPAHMYNDLVEDNWKDLLGLELSGKARIQNDQDLISILGFNIYMRGKDNLQRYTNAATPVKKTPDASSGTTDNAAAILWQERFVRRAKGAVKVYNDIDNPLYYGSVFSAMARLGGAKRYTDGRGVIAIVEAAGS